MQSRRVRPDEKRAEIVLARHIHTQGRAVVVGNQYEGRTTATTAETTNQLGGVVASITCESSSGCACEALKIHSFHCDHARLLSVAISLKK